MTETARISASGITSRPGIVLFADERVGGWGVPDHRASDPED
jgi:hypothetical protein